MRKRFIQPTCLKLDCRECTIISEPNDFWTQPVNVLTDDELEAHERKIWEAARNAFDKFLDDCDRYPMGLGDPKLLTYDDYKKSLEKSLKDA